MKFLCTFLAVAGLSASEPSLQPFAPAAQKIISAASNSPVAFERLAYLCDTFGPRFSGTTNLELAIDWIVKTMQADGFNVRGEKVMVPHWVRGSESAEMISPRPHKLPMLGLGGSVGTPPEGITAEVLVVKSFDDLHRQQEKAKGKIVLFNQPFTDYEETVVIRAQGASEAAKAGGVASLIRSVTPFSLQTPHTGMMRYAPGIAQIPHAAITIEDSELLQRLQDRGQTPRVKLMMSAQTLQDVPSRNVVCDWPGREKSEDIVLLSGHIDSWDVGQGAMDDGGGCLIAWESLRLLKQLGLHPRRTVRVVLWTNEENGVAGARAYVKEHAAELPNHILALESDEGCFEPQFFAFSGSETALQKITEIAGFLRPTGIREVTKTSGSTDISFLVEKGVPGIDLVPDRSKYFWYHHTHGDTIDKLKPVELNACVGATSALAYIIAETGLAR
jgi:carboxypeptidase Q